MIEQEVREECWADMDEQMEQERRRWQAAMDEQVSRFSARWKEYYVTFANLLLFRLAAMMISWTRRSSSSLAVSTFMKTPSSQRTREWKNWKTKTSSFVAAWQSSNAKCPLSPQLVSLGQSMLRHLPAGQPTASAARVTSRTLCNA